MPLNPYFNHVGQTNEQDLYHDLAIELIQLSGIEVCYIRVDATTDGNFDAIFGENRFENLNNYTKIEMYLKDMEQPYESGDMYSKFGLYTPDRCTFLVSLRRFEEIYNGNRPREGDYIYIPSWDKRGPDDIFRVTYTDVETGQFKALGNSIFYFIRAERAKYNHQNVNTGLPVIDQGTPAPSQDGLVDNDTNAQNDPLKELGDLLIDFSESNPFGEP